jgi:hypothetical protein
VGSTIAPTQLVNLLFPHCIPLYEICLRACLRCWDRGCTLDRTRTRALAQYDLNQLHLGVDMLLDERYASAFVTIFVHLIYAVCCPVLIPILAVFFVTTYWVDKYLFVRVYATPIQYNAKMASVFVPLLPWALVAHLAVAVWALTNDDLFRPRPWAPARSRRTLRAAA